MIISISNPVTQTYIFSGLLFLALLLSVRKRNDQDFFPISISQELKGFAILTVVFAHIAYALVNDSRFLYPLSTMAGVGVNLFLILSGYGLMLSSLKNPVGPWQFYKHRLAKLYIPFWICLAAFFILDYWLLNINYGLGYMVKSFLGFFNHADLYIDVNSPFWYLTWIIAYYLIFPWLLIKKAPWLSAVLIYVPTLVLVTFPPHFLDQVIHLYRVHIIAFPLGMLIAYFFNGQRFQKLVEISKEKRKGWIHIVSCIILLSAIAYLAKHSGVGEKPIIEESLSIVTSLLLIALFLVKRIEIKAFYWLGFFSYEIYMFHWPIMYRYDFLFKYMPAWLALSLYILIFIGLAWVLELAIDKGGKLLTKKAS